MLLIITDILPINIVARNDRIRPYITIKTRKDTAIKYYFQMHLLQVALITLSSALATQFQSQALCSAAVKSLGLQTSEFSDQEFKALADYQCFKNKNCNRGISKLKAQSPKPQNELNATEIQQRMSRNESSVQVYSWGYRLYIPPSVQARSNDKWTIKCVKFHGLLRACGVGMSATTNPAGLLLFCSLYFGPAYTCDKIHEALDAIELQGGAILTATWVKAMKPTIEAASKYYPSSNESL